MTFRKNADLLHITSTQGDSRSIEMVSFSEIERRRIAHGVTRKALYEGAGVHKETWRRTAQGRTAPNSRTLEKLNTALDALIAERAARCAQKVNCDEGGTDALTAG